MPKLAIEGVYKSTFTETAEVLIYPENSNPIKNPQLLVRDGTYVAQVKFIESMTKEILPLIRRALSGTGFTPMEVSMEDQGSPISIKICPPQDQQMTNQRLKNLEVILRDFVEKNNKEQVSVARIGNFSHSGEEAKPVTRKSRFRRERH